MATYQVDAKKRHQVFFLIPSAAIVVWNFALLAFPESKIKT